MMKLTCLLLVATFVQVSAAVYSQNSRVTFQVKECQIERVFELIEQQSGYAFVYNHEQLGKVGHITADFKNEEVCQVLDVCLKGSGLTYEMVDNTIVIRVQQEQKKTVILQGKVVGKDSVSVPGVTVKLKGTNVGTATDLNGNFKLVVPEGTKAVLIFSFIGMKQVEKAVKDGEPIRVVMEEDAAELEEVNVVSTGYYNVDKRHLTSSVTSLKMDDIMMPGVSTLDQMLEGRVPGMIFMQNSGQVGAAPKIKIRGTTTLLGSTAPLWVLDGVILQDPVNVDPSDINDLDFVNLLGNAISGLNPEDIDRIDVLKDASATAIYGPKASNGVIVITSKKGKIGAPRVSYSLTGTLRQRPRYSDRAISVMNSQERVDFSREVIRKKLITPDLESYVGYEAAYNDYIRGKITFDEFSKRVTYMEGVNTDWLGLLLHDSYSHNHTLSVSGGSENVRYYTSLGYSSENGNLRGEANDRYNAMAKVDVNYNKFTMSFNLNGNVQKREYTPSEVGLMTYATNTARSVGAYDENGKLMYYQRENEDDTYNKLFNIINERDNTSDDIKSSGVSVSVNLGYNIHPSLKADVQFSFNTSNTEERIYFGEKSWYAANLRREYHPTKGSNAGVGVSQSSLMPVGGELRINNTKSESYGLRGTLTYSKYLDEEKLHQISVAAIGEINSSLYTGFAITKRGYIAERGLLFENVNLPSTWGYIEYKDYDNWLKSDVSAKGVLTDNLTRQAGLVGTFFYAYKDAYIFNANIRIDASNKFGDASNEKLNPIWSVSGRWNIHENLLNEITWVNTLALKGSFGYQGNMSAQDSPNLIIEKKETHFAFNEYYSTIKYFPNPDLKWEKTSTYNIDLEYAMFNNKLVGNFSYYYRHTTHAFMAKSVSSVNGVESYTVNRGTLNNQGFEFSFNFTPINTMLNNAGAGGERNGFVWRFNPNFGTVFNQLIDKLKPKDKVLQDEIKYGDYLSGKVQVAGRPVNTFYSYKFTGLSPEDGRPMFYGIDRDEVVGKDKNGNDITREKLYESMLLSEVCGEVMEHSGCREPFLQGGINNYFGWRNWGLSFDLSYSIGSKIRLLKMYSGAETAVPGPQVNMRGEFIDRWRRPGDEATTNIPGLMEYENFKATKTPWWNKKAYEFAGTIWSMYDNSNVRVVSGNYLKLSGISLRYIVPDRICRLIYMQSAYLNLSGTNLFTLCSKELKGQDPSQSGSSALINISVRPTYSLSLNVSF